MIYCLTLGMQITLYEYKQILLLYVNNDIFKLQWALMKQVW